MILRDLTGDLWPLGGLLWNFYLVVKRLKTSRFVFVNMKRAFLASEWPWRPNLTSDLKSEAKI